MISQINRLSGHPCVFKRALTSYYCNPFRVNACGKINLLLNGGVRCFLLFAPAAPLFARRCQRINSGSFYFFFGPSRRRQLSETTGCRRQRNFAKSSKGNLACTQGLSPCHFKTHLKFSVKFALTFMANFPPAWMRNAWKLSRRWNCWISRRNA